MGNNLEMTYNFILFLAVCVILSKLLLLEALLRHLVGSFQQRSSVSPAGVLVNFYIQINNSLIKFLSNIILEFKCNLICCICLFACFWLENKKGLHIEFLKFLQKELF